LSSSTVAPRSTVKRAGSVASSVYKYGCFDKEGKVVKQLEKGPLNFTTQANRVNYGKQCPPGTTLEPPSDPSPELPNTESIVSDPGSLDSSNSPGLLTPADTKASLLLELFKGYHGNTNFRTITTNPEKFLHSIHTLQRLDELRDRDPHTFEGTLLPMLDAYRFFVGELSKTGLSSATNLIKEIKKEPLATAYARLQTELSKYYTLVHKG
jgi:hypothetical protein